HLALAHVAVLVVAVGQVVAAGRDDGVRLAQRLAAKYFDTTCSPKIVPNVNGTEVAYEPMGSSFIRQLHGHDCKS
ncbi:MAG: hypothetical protein KDH89_11895, partial [Anaerolineae bacterium]|nr:hypothetical protein [Anaerolineae bacterium]